MDSKQIPTSASLAKVQKLVSIYTEKSGTTTHPDETVTASIVMGLARNLDELGRPLCPCRFYPDRVEESKHRTWICACDDMQIYKYCHCLLFVNEEGKPITEHLPQNHEALQTYGLVLDPAPDKGRPLRSFAAKREEERINRPS